VACARNHRNKRPYDVDSAGLGRCLVGAPLIGLAEKVRRAAFVVAPSRWDEPCPYSVIEAMAAGVPVLASARGGLPELVGEQRTLPDRDVAAWAGAMRELWSDPDLRRARAAEALNRARDLFGRERFYAALMDVYATAGAP